MFNKKSKLQVFLIKYAGNTAIFLLSFSLALSAMANPDLNNVAAGNVSINQSGNTLNIDQSSQKAILNWNSFNIGANETTNFNQPTNGVALNRISPLQGASEIYGHLNATGQIILMNPAGVYFGPNAYVNVGGIIATTANMSDQNFLSGQYHFDSVPSYNGSIINEGRIIANNGLVALVAPQVVNHGIIKVNFGNIILGSGKAFTVDFAGDGLVNFQITEGNTESGTGVTNTGKLIANGGTILVSAKAASGVLDNAINMGGIVEANSVAQKNGVIIFSGDDDAGVVNVTGKVLAKGKNAGETGGVVKITGHDVMLDANAYVDVSGEANGGHIQIGRDDNGRLANSTVILPGATLDASSVNGNGGFVETSADYLAVNGVNINTASTYGARGMWLLDPTNLVISTAANSNVNGATPFQNQTNADSNLNSTTLTNALANSDVTVTTSTGDITLDASVGTLTWAAATSLTLGASNNIYLNANITATNGSLILNAADQAQSITSGSEASPNAAGVTANINVKNFSLQQGQWYQVASNLPQLNVSNSFYLNIPTVNTSSTVGFLRATSGNGTVTTPYTLTDVYGLEGVASDTALINKYWALANSIDASNTINWVANNGGSGFNPIGSTGLNSGFLGFFDGHNFTVNNLYVNAPNGTVAGLFGEVANYGQSQNIGIVQNVGVVNANVIGNFITGGLAGFVSAGAQILNSYSTGSVTGTPGGVSGLSGVGGLIGSMGTSSTIVSNSYSTANVYSPNSYNNAGGLVGNMNDSASITNSYAMGSVNVTGATSGGNSSVGGLVGIQRNGTITNSYSTGDVILSTAGTTGGLVGSQTAGTISNSFWDLGTSGQNASAGTGATGLSTANMQTLSTYTNAGWNIAASPSVGNMWNIIDGSSYPFLSSFYASTPSVITGNITGDAGIPLNLLTNGALLSSASIGANGYYYFLLANGAMTTNQVGILYAKGGSVLSNLIFTAPSNQFVLNNLNLSPNTITIGTANTATITLAQILAAKGSVTDATNILFSASGANLVSANNINVTTTANTTLDTQGGLQSAGGTDNYVFNGAVNLSGSTAFINATGDVTFNGLVTTAAASTVGGNNITFANGIGNSPVAGQLTVNANGNVSVTGALAIQSLAFNNASAAGSLTLNTGATQTWNINSANAGTIIASSAGGITFNGFATLVGSNNTNNFIVNGGSLSGGITGVGSNNKLTGSNLNFNTFTLTGTNSGNVSANGTTAFTGIQNLVGGTAGNNFILNGGSLSGSVTGTGSNNTLTGNNSSFNTFTVTSANMGNVSNNGTTAFSNIGTLIGGNAGNSFIVNGGSLTGGITGMGSNNMLTGSNATFNTFTLTGANSGSLTAGGTTAFSGIQNVMGGTAGNSFVLSGGTLSGSITGVGSNNTLTADNVANTFNINGANTGNVTGVSGTFSNIQNLTGGNVSNAFVFANNASLSGTLNGGATSAVNSLDYTAYSTPITVALADNIMNGTVTNNSSTPISNFINISTDSSHPIAANANLANTLSLPNKASTLTITGTIGNGVAGFVSDPTYFSGFSSFINGANSTPIINVPYTGSPYDNTVRVNNGATPIAFNGFVIPNPAPTPTPTPAPTPGNTFSTPVQQVIQQTDSITIAINPTQNPQYVNQNIDQFLNQVDDLYNVNLDNVTVNPYCTALN